MDNENRNIIPKYWNWTNEAIREDLASKRHNFSVLCQNIQGDFNLSSIIRNTNAFLGQDIYIYGKKKWDKRGAVGTYWYENLNYVKMTDNLEDVFSQFDLIISIDNVAGSKPIETYEWDYSKKVLMIFGEEGDGITPDLLNKSHDVLSIKQYGSVRSINVACASAVAMFSYCQGLPND